VSSRYINVIYQGDRISGYDSAEIIYIPSTYLLKMVDGLNPILWSRSIFLGALFFLLFFPLFFPASLAFPFDQSTILTGLHFDGNTEDFTGNFTYTASSPQFTDDAISGEAWRGDVEQGQFLFAKGITLRHDQDFSVVCWAKTSQQDEQTLLGFSTDGFYSYQVLFRDSDQDDMTFYPAFNPADGRGCRAPSQTAVSDGKWHFYVGVRDGKQDKSLIYVDGVLEGTGSGCGTSDLVDGEIRWFTRNSNTKEHLAYRNWGGIADECMIILEVLPSEEIKELYGSQRTASSYLLSDSSFRSSSSTLSPIWFIIVGIGVFLSLTAVFLLRRIFLKRKKR